MSVSGLPPAPAPGESSPRQTAGGLQRWVQRVWDAAFGPPRVSVDRDGVLHVRLMGRRFIATTRAGLFDMVERERSLLVRRIATLHAGAGHQPLLTAPRIVDTIHREAQQLQDRVGIYSEFLGRLGREMDEGKV